MHLSKFIAAAFLFCSLSSSVDAASCRAEQSAAEAALRYQAQLRVIALSCPTTVSGGSLYTDYQSFVARNQDVLDDYQSRLLSYYKAHGKGNPETRLRTRDTEINNEESLDAARGGIAAFCRAHTADLTRAASQNSAETRNAIEAAHGKCS